MNAKQAFPMVAVLSPEVVAAVPPLLIIGGLVALAAWFFSGDDKKETENAPAKEAPATKPSPIPPDSGRNLTENRGIMANPSGKSSVPLARTAIPANSATTAAKIPAKPTLPSGQTAPATAATECQGLRVPFASGGKVVQNRHVPPDCSGKPSAMPVPASIPASLPSAMPKIPVPKPPVPAVNPTLPIPRVAQKKTITRADMAKIFNGGTRGLTRKSAVAALKALGFGKTAAYEALAINGRFTSWLQFAPDGVITWKS